MRLYIVIRILFLSSFLLVGCSEDNTIDWKPTPAFIADDMDLHGTKGEFGIRKVNGEVVEPEFPVVDQGRLYQLYFLDSTKDFNGKTYKMLATHKDSEETIELYEDSIENNQSGAKFVLEKTGLWKIDILVDNELYTSFVIEAKTNE
ncbi:hypothetical protein [Paenisporosarcina quisquiliarum]|uniref:hypothetical protein n=1 Tax=Paenisporosarcina quisquiliarum TaxID=365346 RepID=UPI003735730D